VNTNGKLTKNADVHPTSGSLGVKRCTNTSFHQIYTQYAELQKNEKKVDYLVQGNFGWHGPCFRAFSLILPVNHSLRNITLISFFFGLPIYILYSRAY
jgi:hypothetical protein